MSANNNILDSGPELNFLHAVSTRIAAADPIHEVLDQIVEFISELVQCDSCFVYVKEGESLVLRASKNAHPAVVNTFKLRIGEGITGWVAERAEAVVLSERAFADPRYYFVNELPEDRFEAFLSMPILSRGRVVGVVNVQHRDRYDFQAREVKIISTVGHLVGAAIEVARLEEEVLSLTTKLETRKVLDRAKGILQRDLGIAEDEAYSMIQKQARQRRKTMAEISKAILLSDELRKTK
ncbi:MAG TPA: GAF domain-containing protein [Terriglobales bacterium]|nr:GAF domain-containing protein [Terriglobales bacterium]